MNSGCAHDAALSREQQEPVHVSLQQSPLSSWHAGVLHSLWHVPSPRRPAQVAGQLIIMLTKVEVFFAMELRKNDQEEKEMSATRQSGKK